MTPADQILSLLTRMRDAASDARRLIDGIEKSEFLQNIMVNRSVGMSLLMTSEIAAQIMRVHPQFVSDHPEFPWGALRGMRNRIAHNYFDINLEIIWDTVRNDVPDLVSQVDAIINWHAQGE